MRIFQKTQYLDGNIYRQTKDTINTTNEPIDIYFFNRHFNAPYYLPETFNDHQNSYKTISVWRDPAGKKDYQENWENTYTYDSLGQLINYTYSGCFICSNLPYSYSVTYNSVGKVDRIFNGINTKDSFRFQYDKNGNVIKLETYLHDQLDTVIELLN